MTVKEYLERVRLHCGDYPDNDIILLYNRFAKDFCMRTRYGLFEHDDKDTVDTLFVIKLDQAVINDNQYAAVLEQTQHQLEGRLVTHGNSYYVSVFNNKAYLWYAAGDKILREMDWDDMDSVKLYGVFYRPVEFDSDRLSTEIDDVMSSAMLYKTYSELLSRDPKTFELSEKYEMKYDKEIVLTKRRYNLVATKATLKFHDM